MTYQTTITITVNWSDSPEGLERDLAAMLRDEVTDAYGRGVNGTRADGWEGPFAEFVSCSYKTEGGESQ